MTLRTLLVGGLLALVGLFAGIAIGGKTAAQQTTPGDPPPQPLQFPKRLVEPAEDETTVAMKLAKTNESAYRNAIDINKKKPGTVADMEVERLHRLYVDDMLTLLRKQVEAQQAQIQMLRTPRTRLLSSGGSQ
jgi:hypothetical protein